MVQLCHVGHHVVVGQIDSLGRTGRPGRVRKDHDVLGGVKIIPVVQAGLSELLNAGASALSRT